MKSHFTKEGIQMANKLVRRYSVSLADGKIQNKTMMRCHYTTTRIAKIKNGDKTKCWQRCGKIESLQAGM